MEWIVETIPLAPEAEGAYVREAPRFSDQVADASRVKEITTLSWPGYLHSSIDEWHSRDFMRARMEDGSMTTKPEHELLVELGTFLSELPPQAKANEHSHFWEQETVSAADLREHVTIIGNPEYDEAVGNMAEEVRGLLAAGKQVCMPTGIIEGAYDDRYKSDTYLIDNLLAKFTPAELKQYAKQLILNLEDITATGDDLHIWLLDDLTLSGSAMSRAVQWYVDEYPSYVPNTQIRLVVAPKALIRSGFTPNHQPDKHIPIYAYFGAHELPEGRAKTTNGALITTAFTAPLAGFGEVMADFAKQQGVNAPGLVNIQRPYLAHDYQPERIIAYRKLQSEILGRKVGALATRVIGAHRGN